MSTLLFELGDALGDEAVEEEVDSSLRCFLSTGEVGSGALKARSRLLGCGVYTGAGVLMKSREKTGFIIGTGAMG